MASVNLARLVVAEIIPEIVNCIRKNGCFLTVNIAYADRVEAVPVGPVEIYNPWVAKDRQKLVEALVYSHEISTAVPAVRYYTSPGPESLSRILAAGLQAKVKRDGPRAVIYAAENHNHAAEILEASVLEEILPAERASVRSRVQFLNTVIGKMSGVVTGLAEIASLSLTPMTPDSDRAFLVEAFNRIL